MKGDRHSFVSRAVLSPFPLLTGIYLSALIVLLCSCGGSQNKVYKSLQEAKRQAARKDTWIVVEFWRHG